MRGPLSDHLTRSAHTSLCLSSATAAWIAAVMVAIRASFAAELRSKAAFFRCCFYSFGGTVGSSLHGVAGDHRPGFAQASLWITPSAGRGSPIGVGMFEPCAPMSMHMRKAMPPVVLPAGGTPAPPAGVVNQFDRPGPKLVRAAIGYERGRQRRWRHG